MCQSWKTDKNPTVILRRVRSHTLVETVEGECSGHLESPLGVHERISKISRHYAGNYANPASQ